MKLSIVATLYNSAAHLEEFYKRTSIAARSAAGEDYEIVLINDGSPDRSLEQAIKISSEDSHVITVDLSRNFGHHKAMMTGLSFAKGDYIFLIDSDLEEDPAWLSDFFEKMHNDNCDVVYGVQAKRKGGFFEKLSGSIFWKMINTLSGLSIPENIVTTRLMKKTYVEALLLHKEREVFMAGLWVITGFDQKEKIVNKLSISKSTYTFSRKLALLVNSVTSFSNLPLIGIFYIGLFIFSFACLYAGYLVVNWWFFSTPLAGWTSVMASIWILGGLVISLMGIIGIYLSKIFSESKQRPYTIVRQVYSRQ